jgi:hypothetical protein
MGILSAVSRAAKASKAAPKSAPKPAAEKVPPVGLLSDWQWRPEAEIASQLSISEVPRYIQDGYGRFMVDQANRVKSGAMGPRDLAKAYGITRSSVGRTSREINDDLAKGSVRPEGYMAEWLLSPTGKTYLNNAQKGIVNSDAIVELENRFGPFGMANTLAQDLQYGALALPGRAGEMRNALQGTKADWRSFAQALNGIGPAKSGFVASALGRGDIPTLDARQLVLQTGQPAKKASKYMRRGRGAGGDAAVDRLAERQSNMNLRLDRDLEPHRQHLTHHTIWDRIGDEQTTHDDLVRALRLAGMGGAVAVGAGLLGEEPD